MRLFVAVSPDAAARAAAAAMQAEVRSLTTLDARWVAPESLHLTLAFLGSVDEAALPGLRDALAVALAAVPPFAVGLGGPGAFPSGRRPRVLWLGVERGAEGLAALAGVVRTALRSLRVGYDETAPFRPHLTIARVRTPRRDRALAERLARPAGTARTVWEVRSVTLFESILGAAGARHRPEAVLPLGGG
jgi:2'-5' RNA ligase